MGNLGQPYALYEKIKRSVTRDIDSGKLLPGDKIPSETKLAKVFNASRMTANRALKELTEENRIIRIQGVGTFVAEPKPEASLLEIKSIAREINDWGGSYSCEVLLLKEERLSRQIAVKMDLAEGDRIFHSIILHQDRGIGIQYSERYINPVVAPFYLDQDFTKMTPSDYLLKEAPIQEAEHVIEAVSVNKTIQQYLNIRPEDPCLSLTRRTWSFDRVATYTRIISPGSRYKLTGKFNRG
ncbi:MAG: histidine utilization repressor [Desulfobacteraceae bacterium]|nr:histidine utilization repressor [Desulfobacteraceae bacterium]